MVFAEVKERQVRSKPGGSAEKGWKELEDEARAAFVAKFQRILNCPPNQHIPKEVLRNIGDGVFEAKLRHPPIRAFMTRNGPHWEVSHFGPKPAGSRRLAVDRQKAK
jgi:hypothetical protein